MSKPSSLASFPTEILALILDNVSNIEDFMNLSSSCRKLRACANATKPDTILRLASEQTRVFFRPSPYFLVAATARQLGDWARESDANEAKLCRSAQRGIDGLLDLAVKHCGLTMERIRELHAMRPFTFSSVENILDDLGRHVYETPDSWIRGAYEASPISADPPVTLFHLAIYGELFSPDLEAYLDSDEQRRTLKVETRLEYIKNCLPDYATSPVHFNDDDPDLGRTIFAHGIYSVPRNGPITITDLHTYNIALTYVLMSFQWRLHWKAIRSQAAADFDDNFRDEWRRNEDPSQNWRQRLWENVIVCQGLDGLKMICPYTLHAEKEPWLKRIRVWREKIEKLSAAGEVVSIELGKTHTWPYLLGDLRCCGWADVVAERTGD